MSLATKFRGYVGSALADVVASRVRRVLPAKPISQIDTHDADGTLTVASYFSRPNGITAGAEMQISALRALGFRATAVDVSRAIRHPLAAWRNDIDIRSAVTIVHSDGRMAAMPLNYMRKHLSDVIRVGYCAWELPEPPRAWGAFDEPFNEVWVPSRFCRMALEQMCTRSVRVVRHVVGQDYSVSGPSARQRLGLRKEDFVVLAMADLRSSLARKNPIGAVEAFRLALGHRTDCALVLKVSGVRHDPASFLALREATNGTRVVIVDQYLDTQEKWALYESCDVFLSLHRAEGFGLPLAEAMFAGKPTVATGWSGNLDFMDSGNSALVDFDLCEVRDPQGVYRTGKWAEPRLDHAIGWLSDLYGNPQLRSELSQRARQSMAPEAQARQFSSQLPDWVRHASPEREAV